MLANQVGIHNSKLRVDFWNEFVSLSGTNIKCVPFANCSTSGMSTDGKVTLTLPSLKMEHLLVLIKSLPYEHLAGVSKIGKLQSKPKKSAKKSKKSAKAGTADTSIQDTAEVINWKGFRALSSLFCATMEAVARGDGSEGAKQVSHGDSTCLCTMIVSTRFNKQCNTPPPLSPPPAPAITALRRHSKGFRGHHWQRHSVVYTRSCVPRPPHACC